MPPFNVSAALLREAAVRYAWRFIGRPYRWAGDDPMQGFDCSGLVVEVLQSVGLLPHGSDLSANGLWIKYKNRTVVVGYQGCLCLWLNQAGVATHVEMMVNDFQTLGASGGGSATTSEEAAAAQNAFVKVRPLGYRGSNFKLVDPFPMAV